MTDKQDGRTPFDFVYGGRRTSTKGKSIVALFRVLPDGTLGKEPMLFDAKAFKGRIIGGVYTGASVAENGTTIYGLNAMRYSKRWHDAAAILGWEGLDDEHDRDAALRRTEKSHRSLVEQELWNVRVMVHQLRKRGAHHDVATVINMVNELIYRPLTKEEQARLLKGNQS